MKNLDKHEFDEIFRSGLIAPEQQEVDEDWALMKGRLEQQDARSRIPEYMLFLSAIAAVLLLVFSVLFNASEPLQEQAVISGKVQVNGSERVEKSSVENTPKQQTGNVQPIASIPAAEILAARSYTPARSGIEVSGPLKIKSYVHLKNTEDVIAANTGSITHEISNETPILAVVEPVNSRVAGNETETATENQINYSVDAAKTDAAERPDQASSTSNPGKSRFSLAINIAPDLNGVEHLQNNKVSYSLGAALIYKLSNKFSVEAGAAYGKKTYQTGFSSFRPSSYNLFQVKPNLVSSGFDIMDIQLNLAYTMFSKGKSSLGVGAGISSYLMLDEQYSFTYPNQNARGLSSFNTGYQNNHFFGIANLSVSYQRSLTNNIKLSFNPYLKLPLTDLGYGNIRLRSAGMSVGVITNLNKINKK